MYAEAYVCNSVLSLVGVCVYCIINIRARFGNIYTFTEQSRNVFACESVFLYQNIGAQFPNVSLFIV